MRSTVFAIAIAGCTLASLPVAAAERGGWGIGNIECYPKMGYCLAAAWETSRGRPPKHWYQVAFKDPQSLLRSSTSQIRYHEVQPAYWVNGRTLVDQRSLNNANLFGTNRVPPQSLICITQDSIEAPFYPYIEHPLSSMHILLPTSSSHYNPFTRLVFIGKNTSSSMAKQINTGKGRYPFCPKTSKDLQSSPK